MAAAQPALELSLSPEKAFYILEKARELEGKVELTNPDDASNPADDRAVHILEDVADDPTRDELVAAIEALDDDELTDLVALLWLGRSDFTVEEWAEGRRLARERRKGPVADYFLSEPLASDYLEEGLSLFGHALTESEAAKHL